MFHTDGVPPGKDHLPLIPKGTVGLTIDGHDSLYGPSGMRTNESSRPFEIRLGTRSCTAADVPRLETVLADPALRTRPVHEITHR
ncbi:hypothetical protein ACFXKG_20765 [Streptomyces sp. NPDC059255]|uniref:hypothetical protein n=1 Tax=Streptomyces sp. NPDC059255 TaxID=3346793 RepID=UPI0036C30CBD